jgi:predicted alpha/beta hydrolase family esterase
MKILFLHGLESKPGGTKPGYLSKAGHVVINPALPRSGFEMSVKIAQDIIDTEQPDIVVGSSRGGAVAMAVNTLDAPIVLIAPAWKRYLSESDIATWDIRCEPQKVIVLHSKDDDVIPIEDSEELKNTYGISVMKVGTNHRMSDNDALEALADVVTWLGKQVES